MPANDYYDSTGTPSTNTLASSASMRAEFDAVEAGFTAVQAALALKAVAADMTAALALKANATNAVLITPNIGTPSAGVVTNLTGTAAGVSIGGNAATATLASTVTTNANLTGDVTSAGNVTTLNNAPVIAKVLTGYTSAPGVISATDSILTAIQKLNGNNNRLVWSVKTTNYTAVAGDAIMANTTSGAFTITLPASPAANDVVDIADYAGTFGTNNLTIGRNSSKIKSLAEDMTVSASNVKFRLTYIDSTVGWGIV